jgi:hypothetical protein
MLALALLLAVSSTESASIPTSSSTPAKDTAPGSVSGHTPTPPDFSAFLQLQYLSVVRDAQPSPAETGFLLRRARVAASGTALSPLFAYRAELELSNGRLAPLDLYAAFNPSAHWSIRAGQVRVPFSRNWMISEERLSFSERSIATEEFRYDYDIGVLATASFINERLLASLGIMNGAGRNAVGNDNVDPLFVARVNGTLGGAPPLGGAGRAPTEAGDLAITRPPSLTLGAAATLDYVPEPAAYGFSGGTPVIPVPIVAHDTNGNGRPDGVRVFQLEGDLSFRWRGLAIDAEAYFRRESWAEIGSAQPDASQFSPKQRFGGAFAQATYFLPAAHLEAGGRVAVAELSPLAVDGRTRPATTCTGIDGLPFPCTLPFTERRSEVTVVAVGHWFGHGVQIVGMYSALRWRTDRVDLLPWSREQRFLLQTQLAF